MKRIMLFSILVLLLLCACGQSEGPLLIRVAVCPTSPPNLFEEDGTYKGIDMDLFAGFCRARGYRYSITDYDWQEMLSAVVGKQADVAFSAISITEKRKAVLDFSKPYMDNAWHLVSLNRKKIVIKDPSYIKKYSIGYPRGMAYSSFIKNQLEPQGIYRLADVKMYQTYNQVLADLRNGNIDLAFMDSSVAAVYKKKKIVHDSYVFTGIDRFGFAFPKGSPLRDEFNRYLDEMGQEKINAIIERWTN